MRVVRTKGGKKQEKPFLSGNEKWRNQHIQCNGSGWVIGRPVDSLGRTPIRVQKQLRGKNDKSHTTNNIKGGSYKQ